MKKLLLLVTSLLFVMGAFAQWPTNVGPDLYGYTMENFDNSDPRYSWVDITQNGTQVTGLADDNFVGPFDLGFNFQYYWLGRSEIYIGSNGFINFGDAGFNYASQGGGFPNIPNNSDSKNEMIAPLLSDLSFATPNATFPNPAECYFFTNNTDLAIISFINVPFWCSPQEDPAQWRGANSFQIHLRAFDSTVRVIYLQQDGKYADAYDPDPGVTNPDPAPVVVGIENVTGTIGLGINASVSAANLLPLAQTGSEFKPPVTPQISIPDLEVFNIQNNESAGFFLPVPGSSFFVDADLVNVGNTDILTPTTIDAEINQGGNPLYVDQVTVNSVAQGSRSNFTFNAPLILPIAGSYEFTVDLSNQDDINLSNDQKIVEVNALDTTGGVATFGYIPDDFQSNLIANGIGAQVLWTGGMGRSGAGVYIEPYGYPTTFTAADFYLFPSIFLDQNGQPTINRDTIADGDYRVTVHQSDPNGGIPGNILLLDTVITKDNVDIGYIDPNDPLGQVLLGDWNRVVFPQPIEVTSGGLYVAWYHFNDSLQLLGEDRPPFSRRSYEILDDSWAPHRSRNEEDYGIRLVADVSKVTAPPSSIDEEVSDIVDFDAFPNPSEGIVNLDVSFEAPTFATVRVVNITGVKAYYNAYRATTRIQETIDLSKLAKGIYLIQVETENGIQTKKVAVQ